VHNKYKKHYILSLHFMQFVGACFSAHEGDTVNMFSSEEILQTTEALEKLPRTFDRRSALNERRQHILQQKQTDALPSLGSESPSAKWVWRQMVQLREENSRLRVSLDSLQTEVQQLYLEKSTAQSGLESDLAVVHSGHQQEIAHYQTHLLELMDERNRLQDEYKSFVQTHQDVLQRFDVMVVEETQKRLQELSETHIASDWPSVPLQTFVKTAEAKARANGERFLAEAMHWKREVERIAETLEHEQRQLEEERQQLVVFQHSVSEQSVLRHKALNDRLRLRWRATAVVTSVGLLALLIVLQFVFLSFFHVSLNPPTTIAILAPVVICTFVALMLASPPFQFYKHMYLNAPHKKKIR
jgi:hypothetical protein